MAKDDSLNLEELLHSAYRYALSLTHNPACAEDLVQDAWLAVLTAKGPQTRSYLLAAVRSRFLNRYKREQLVSIVSLEDAPELEEVFDETAFVCYRDHALLEKGMNDLRAVEREALFLMAVEGYTANEIAAFTQHPRGTVLSHIHRAKQKLKRFFSTHHIKVAP